MFRAGPVVSPLELTERAARSRRLLLLAPEGVARRELVFLQDALVQQGRDLAGELGRLDLASLKALFQPSLQRADLA